MPLSRLLSFSRSISIQTCIFICISAQKLLNDYVLVSISLFLSPFLSIIMVLRFGLPFLAFIYYFDRRNIIKEYIYSNIIQQKKYERLTKNVQIIKFNRKMPVNKSRKISLQPVRPSNHKFSNKLPPPVHPRAVSCRPPHSNIPQLEPIRINQTLRKVQQPDRYIEQVNCVVPKKPSINHRQRSNLLGFDNRIFSQLRSKSVKPSYNVGGLSREALGQRKQSNLNTYYNLRKNRLKDITKENKKIYVRINSQKSLYSSRQLNCSQDSIGHSRLSHKSSQHSLRISRNSQKSKQANGKAKVSKKCVQNVKIESKDVKHLQRDEVNRYLNIFCNHLNVNPKNIQKLTTKRHLEPIKEKQNAYTPIFGLEKIIQQCGKNNRKRNPFILGHIL